MTGRLVAVEGIDGSGKRTLVRTVRRVLEDDGRRVASLDFPQYERNAFGRLIRETLTEGAGDLYDSVYGMASLYAADRCQSRPVLEDLLARHDVVLCDRYVSSNAAYAGARLLDGAARDALLAWLVHLEIDLVGLPRPDLQVLVHTPTDVAAARATARAGRNPERSLDSFEADVAYQARCRAVYEELAQRSYLGPWAVVETVAADGHVRTPGELAEVVAAHVRTATAD